MKPSHGFGMVSAMLLLVIIGLLTTWIGVALTDHGRRIKGERIGGEITALRDLMQTFIDLHGKEIKETFVDTNNTGSVKVRVNAPSVERTILTTKKSDHLALDPAQIAKVAETLNWKNHVKLVSNYGNYHARILVNHKNEKCTTFNKYDCTLQILVYLHDPLIFLGDADTVAVQSAMATIGRGGGASVLLAKGVDATHFRFSSHAPPIDARSDFLVNSSNKPGAVAAISDSAPTYQPFLHRDGGQMRASLHMNQQNIENVKTISGIENIVVTDTLAVNNNGKSLIFSADSLSSDEGITIASPSLTIGPAPAPGSTGSSKLVSMKEGHLTADALTVNTLTSKEPVQFHKNAAAGSACKGSQISFAESGEPYYCQEQKWQPFKKEIEKIKEVIKEKDCPPCPKPPPPPHTREPQFKEGTMKWIEYSASVLLPFGERVDNKSVFFLGSEWNHCYVDIEYGSQGYTQRYVDRDKLVELRRSKFTTGTSHNSDLLELGKEPTWQMITNRRYGTEQYNHTYIATCYRPAILGSDNKWHMGSLAPLTGEFSTDRSSVNYRRPQYHRIEKLNLKPVQ